MVELTKNFITFGLVFKETKINNVIWYGLILNQIQFDFLSKHNFAYIFNEWSFWILCGSCVGWRLQSMLGYKGINWQKIASWGEVGWEVAEKRVDETIYEHDLIIIKLEYLSNPFPVLTQIWVQA